MTEFVSAKYDKDQLATLPGDIRKFMEDSEVFKNDLYTVAVRPMFIKDIGLMIHLSIKRNDRECIHDWRDLQEIKNKLVGVEAEACELYPAESRLVDCANQYHLWVLPEGAMFPFGFTQRMTGTPESAASVGAKQRAR